MSLLKKATVLLGAMLLIGCASKAPADDSSLLDSLTKSPDKGSVSTEPGLTEDTTPKYEYNPTVPPVPSTQK